jgi:flagellar biosynthesis protein FliR
MTFVLALRGAAAVLVLTTLTGGLPRLVQLGIAVAVGLWAALLVDAPPDATSWLVVAAHELVVGATIGVVAAVPLLAAATAGRLVDLAGNGRGSYGNLFGLLAAAVFVGIDGHVTVVTAIADSFRTAPPLVELQPRILGTLGGLVSASVRLAIPWLVTAAVVEIAVGVGMRLAGRAGQAAPASAAVPAALVMMTAALVGTLAVAIAAVIRGTLALN